jgi:S1-C subfamily serine protease
MRDVLNHIVILPTIRQSSVCAFVALLSLPCFATEPIGYAWPKDNLLISDKTLAQFRHVVIGDNYPLIKTVSASDFGNTNRDVQLPSDSNTIFQTVSTAVGTAHAGNDTIDWFMAMHEYEHRHPEGYLILCRAVDGNRRIGLLPLRDRLGNPTRWLPFDGRSAGNDIVIASDVVTLEPGWFPFQANQRYPVLFRDNQNLGMLFSFETFTQVVSVAEANVKFMTVADYNQAVEVMIRTLKSKADRALEEGRFGAIREIFGDYQGDFAQYSVDIREKLANEYEERAKGRASVAPPSEPDAQTRYFEFLTTVDGTTYKNVTVTQILSDKIYVRHSKGAGSVLFAELTDETLKKLGLPTKAERQQFEKEQQEKGLVKYEGKWITPEEREKAEGDKKVDRVVMSKFLGRASYTVIQSLADGLLCVLRDSDTVFFLYGASSATIADNETFTDDLYWTGTYTYTMRSGYEKTVNAYATDRNLARRLVQLKFGPENESQPDAPRFPDEGKAADAPDATHARPRAFGSGFFITEDGYLISNNHVVRHAHAIKVKTEGRLLDGKVIAQDPDNDIALIKVEGNFTPVRFSHEKRANMGQTIFTVGFPIPSLQGFNPKVTKGVISSLTGIRDDIRMYQIDATVQPGNSGGPLADERGNVVGVVSARLNESAALEATGSLAQNVNYAVKLSYVAAVLDNYPDVVKGLKASTGSEIISFEQAVDAVRKSTVLVVVY